MDAPLVGQSRGQLRTGGVGAVGPEHERSAVVVGELGGRAATVADRLGRPVGPPAALEFLDERAADAEPLGEHVLGWGVGGEGGVENASSEVEREGGHAICGGLPSAYEQPSLTLESRYWLTHVIVSVMNPLGDDTYEVGYYRVRDTSDSGVAVVTARALCDSNCLALDATHLRLAAGAEGGGAVFFPVLTGVPQGPAIRFHPFALGGSGRLVFEGVDDTRVVDVPALGASPAFVVTPGSRASIRVTRGLEAAPVLIVVRRSEAVAARTLFVDASTQDVDVSPGTGPIEVYLLREETAGTDA